MTLFEAVKNAISTKAAAERYGLAVNHSGMACCPFHDDRHPSLKVDERFHCFGCQADGDVIDFAARLFGLSPKAAAEKLAGDFGISLDLRQQSPLPRRPSVLTALTTAQASQAAERRCIGVLCRYARLLQDWRGQFAPRPADKAWHPLFCEALGNAGRVERLLDVLLSGTQEDRQAAVRATAPEIDALEARLAGLETGRETETAPAVSRVDRPARLHDRAM